MNFLKKAIHRSSNLYKRRKAIRPVFPDTVPVMWILKNSASVYRKIRFRPPDVPNFFKS